MLATRNGLNSSLVMVEGGVSVDSAPLASLALVDAAFALTVRTLLHRALIPGALAPAHEHNGKVALLAVKAHGRSESGRALRAIAAPLKEHTVKSIRDDNSEAIRATPGLSFLMKECISLVQTNPGP